MNAKDCARYKWAEFAGIRGFSTIATGMRKDCAMDCKLSGTQDFKSDEPYEAEADPARGGSREHWVGGAMPWNLPMNKHRNGRNALPPPSPPIRPWPQPTATFDVRLGAGVIQTTFESCS
jgi:hypothetical protein